MARPREYDDDLRVRLVDAAGQLLAAEGPTAVSTRRVATEVGTTTAAIYSLLGSKEELVRAMYREGFDRLGERLAAVPAGPDPLTHLWALGRAYHDAALASPHLYGVMFERPIPEFCPNDDDAALSLGTLQVLIDGVGDCVRADIFAGDAEALAMRFWALAHGVASLTIAGMLTPADAEAILDGGTTALSVGLQAEVAGWTAPHHPARR